MNSPSQPVMMVQEQTPPRWRGGWTAKLLALGALLAVLIVASGWIAGLVSHRASSYGISDPSRAVVRLENRTTDFAITRVSLGEAERNLVDQDIYQEIGPGKEAVIEVEPGAHLLKVSWVEIRQVEAFRPKGDHTETLSLEPGEAAILYLQGGRSSPDGLLSIPPKLVLR